jgi:hypothetical protein
MQDNPDQQPILPQEESSFLTNDAEHTGDAQASHGRTPPLWSTREPPRLLATDSPQHVQLVITKNFGAGVDMDKYLTPARTMFDRFSQGEKDEHKKRAYVIKNSCKLKEVEGDG